MKKRLKRSAWILTCCLLALGSPFHLAAQTASPPSGSSDASAPSDDRSWPRQINSGGTTITIYQPQLEHWSGNQ